MIHRKFGRLLLGKATPFQVIAACVLGSMLGFLPGVLQAPGSVLVLLALLAVLNANLFLAAMVTLGARLLSYALLPAAHATGTFLLEGPTEGLFRSIVNAPVLAWCGFEYHAVTGGWALGGIIGLALGLVLAAAMGKLRRTFLSLDEGSEAFRKWAGKGWVKFLSWLLIGGAPKRETYEKIAQKKLGNPVRPLGAVLVVAAAVVIFAVPALLAEPILTGALRGGLERANGATVDLAKAEVDLGAGRFTLSGLAMADRSELDRDILRSTTVTADLDVGALLRRRWQMDDLVIEQAATGAARTVPGKRIAKETAPPPPPAEPPAPGVPGVSIVTIDEVIEDAKVWHERLEQARRYLDIFIGEEEAPGAAPREETAAERAERVEREIEAYGWRWTRAENLIAKNPTLRLDHLKIARLEAMELAGMLLVLEGWNLSTHPSLVAEPAGLSVASDDGSLRIAVNPVESAGGTPTPETLVLSRKGLPGDTLGRQLRIDGQPVLAGGTIDIEGRGRWWREKGVRVDLPLRFTLRGCEIRIPGSEKMERIEELVLPIGVSGNLLAPRFRFEEKDLINGLVAAGKRELADRARKELGKVGAQVGAEVDRRKQELEAEAERQRKELEEKAKRELEEKLAKELEGKVGKEIEEKAGEEVKKTVEKIGGSLLEGLEPKPKPPSQPPPPPEQQPPRG